MSSSNVFGSDQITQCALHPGEKEIFYCSDHMQWCCLLCGQAHHGQCVNVGATNSIPEDTKTLIVQLKTLRDQFQGEIDSNATAWTDVLTQKEGLAEEIDNFAEAFVNHIRLLKTELLSRMEKRCQQLSDQLSERNAVCDDTVASIRASLTDLDHSIRLRDVELHDTAVDNALEKHREILHSVPECQSLQNPSLRLCLNNRSKDSLEALTSLGDVTIVSEPDRQDSTTTCTTSTSDLLVPLFPSLRDRDVQATVIQQEAAVQTSVAVQDRDMQATVIHQETAVQVQPRSQCQHTQTSSIRALSQCADIDLNRSGSLYHELYSCNITGMAVLPDGRVLLADSGHDRVLLLDSAGSVTATLHLFGPRDVAVTSPGQVVVSLYDCKLQFIDIKSGLTSARTVDVGEECWGVACCRDRLFVVCHSSDSSYVKVLKLNGKQVWKVNVPDAEYCLYCYVTVEPGGCVYVTDRGNGTVTRLSEKGAILGRFYVPGLDRPAGIVARADGTLLVCGWRSDNVVHVTAEGEVIQELLTGRDGISEPLSVCCIGDGRLAVAMGYSNVVKVFNVH